MAKVWWSPMKKDKGIYQSKWKHLGGTKSQGGLDFRDLETFNRALLAKQVQRLVQNPTSLARQILKSKYFRSCNILDAKIGHSPSLIWRSIQSSIAIIKAGIFSRIGDKITIKIWGDKWVLTPNFFKVQLRVTCLHKEASIQ